eukprot:gene49934-42000_t
MLSDNQRHAVVSSTIAAARGLDKEMEKEKKAAHTAERKNGKPGAEFTQK